MTTKRRRRSATAALDIVPVRRAPSARRIARVTRAVENGARRRWCDPRPCDLPGWRTALRAALALAPELPAYAFAGALCSSWGPRREDGSVPSMTIGLTKTPETIAHLAAVVALFTIGADKLSPSARRRALAITDGERLVNASAAARAEFARGRRGIAERLDRSRCVEFRGVEPQGAEARAA